MKNIILTIKHSIIKTLTIIQKSLKTKEDMTLINHQEITIRRIRVSNRQMAGKATTDIRTNTINLIRISQTSSKTTSRSRPIGKTRVQNTRRKTWRRRTQVKRSVTGRKRKVRAGTVSRSQGTARRRTGARTTTEAPTRAMTVRSWGRKNGATEKTNT